MSKQEMPVPQLQVKQAPLAEAGLKAYVVPTGELDVPFDRHGKTIKPSLYQHQFSDILVIYRPQGTLGNSSANFLFKIGAMASDDSSTPGAGNEPRSRPAQQQKQPRGRSDVGDAVGLTGRILPVKRPPPRTPFPPARATAAATASEIEDPGDRRHHRGEIVELEEGELPGDGYRDVDWGARVGEAEATTTTTTTTSGVTAMPTGSATTAAAAAVGVGVGVGGSVGATMLSVNSMAQQVSEGVPVHWWVVVMALNPWVNDMWPDKEGGAALNAENLFFQLRSKKLYRLGGFNVHRKSDARKLLDELERQGFLKGAGGRFQLNDNVQWKPLSAAAKQEMRKENKEALKHRNAPPKKERRRVRKRSRRSRQIMVAAVSSEFHNGDEEYDSEAKYEKYGQIRRV
ncbi:hypothetical protein Pelo_15536 [Pelomyxa schiedti]|nr:hypothetical protein Pelo_15536 [Pelomyxa schiedti]